MPEPIGLVPVDKFHPYCVRRSWAKDLGNVSLLLERNPRRKLGHETAFCCPIDA